MKPLSDYHAQSVESVLASLDVDQSMGLSDAQAADRLAQFGANVLREGRRVSLLSLLLRQLRSPIVMLLVLASLFSLFTHEIAEFIAIIAVLIINTSIGFFTEYQALSSMQTLKELSTVRCRTRRNAQITELDAKDLVPGDILILDAGDVLPADARVLMSASLSCDESALTGESLPVSKSSEPVLKDAVIGDRRCMVFNGCGVSRGTGEAVVTGTGMNTELGHIARLVDDAEAEHSPLEKQLAALSQHLIWLTLGLTALLASVGILAGQDTQMMLKSAVALAVAAIPEGLPIVATLALARGMIRMARRNALIEKLPSVETLGATTVILTDKTGTMTENHMRVSSIRTSQGEYIFDSENATISVQGKNAGLETDKTLKCLIRTAALCNNASYQPEDDTGTGDPMEVALLEVAEAVSLSRNSLVDACPEVHEHAFDSNLRMMATIHSDDSGYFVAVKGAPGEVLKCVTHVMDLTVSGEKMVLDDAGRKFWFTVSEDYGRLGLRLLAVAGKRVDEEDADPYGDLTLYGIVALSDPPRRDVAGAISDAKSAGIRIVMATGDHLTTARFVADSVGLSDADSLSMRGSELPRFDSLSQAQSSELRRVDVFSRVDPEQKLRLIELYQKSGDVVAMTGDGVNDAPALKKADIGIAMGIRGTQVAKEASDMILKDDAFPSIVHAIREGRIIYSNIRRFTVYLLSCNLSEILIVAVAVLLGLPLPLLPLQILFLNLVTDVFPAFALGTIAPKQDVLSRSPRPKGRSILGRQDWLTISISGIILALTTLTALLVSIHWLELEGDSITTVCFLTLALSQLWHLFSMHNWRDGWFDTAVMKNNYVWLAVLLCLLLLALAMLQPQLSAVLHLVELPPVAWLLIVALSIQPWLIREFTATAKRLIRHSVQ
ncbi:MAG: cation-transporting P-type ATPase [Granulosicoccus sp.]|nr:cation-transporting P-type ATPase [Granulosicoccus sp.]